MQIINVYHVRVRLANKGGEVSLGTFNSSSPSAAVQQARHSMKVRRVKIRGAWMAEPLTGSDNDILAEMSRLDRAAETLFPWPEPAQVSIFDASTDAECPCPLCGVFAIVALTPAQRLAQPDDTTHVCNPALGGCNHGFTDSRTRGGC